MARVERVLLAGGLSRRRVQRVDLAVSRNGTLIYVVGGKRNPELVVVQRFFSVLTAPTPSASATR